MNSYDLKYLYAWAYYNLYRMAREVHLTCTKRVHISSLLSSNNNETRLKTTTNVPYILHDDKAYMYIPFHCKACTEPSLFTDMAFMKEAFEDGGFATIDTSYTGTLESDLYNCKEIAIYETVSIAMNDITKMKIRAHPGRMDQNVAQLVNERNLTEIHAIKRELQSDYEENPYSTVFRLAYLAVILSELHFTP